MPANKADNVYSQRNFPYRFTEMDIFDRHSGKRGSLDLHDTLYICHHITVDRYSLYFLPADL